MKDTRTALRLRSVAVATIGAIWIVTLVYVSYIDRSGFRAIAALMASASSFLFVFLLIAGICRVRIAALIFALCLSFWLSAVIWLGETSIATVGSSATLSAVAYWIVSRRCE